MKTLELIFALLGVYIVLRAIYEFIWFLSDSRIDDEQYWADEEYKESFKKRG